MLNPFTPKKSKKTRETHAVPKPSRRHIVIGEAYNSGHSIEKIMADFNIKQRTALTHLLKYIEEGNPIRSDGLLATLSVTPDKIALITETFKKTGLKFLKPIFNALDGKISYEDLSIIRLYCLSKYDWATEAE